MFNEKQREIASVAAMVFVLILSAALFWFRSQAGHSYNNEYFSPEDIEDDWNESRTHHLSLEDCQDTLIIEDGGYYELSGKMTGQVMVSGNSQNVYFIRLNGVDIANDAGACILVENANKVVLELKEGSENLLYTGGGSDDEGVDEKVGEEINEGGGEVSHGDIDKGDDDGVDECIDGAIYSRDDLTIRGSGSLDITTDHCHGIVCNDKLVFTGGNLIIKAKEDGIHANDLVALRNTVMDITAGDDGITAKNDDGTGVFYGESGEILIRDCYEGIEADEVIIENGKYSLYPSDDGVNAMTTVDIRGGDIRISNSEGRDADGIDSNGDVFISGGSFYISLPQSAINMPIDYGEETGGKLEVTGGEIEAYVGGEEVDAIERAAQGMGGGFRGGAGFERPDRSGLESGAGFERSDRSGLVGDAGFERPDWSGLESGDGVERSDWSGLEGGDGVERSEKSGLEGGAGFERPSWSGLEADGENYPGRPPFTDGQPPAERPAPPDGPDFTKRPEDFPQRGAGGFARMDARNNLRSIAVVLGCSALSLALAFLIAIFKKSRVNIR